MGVVETICHAYLFSPVQLLRIRKHSQHILNALLGRT